MYSAIAPGSVGSFAREEERVLDGPRRDNSVLPRRLRNAKHAIMDRIEDSFDTASMAERTLLLAALNTVSELR